MIVGDAVQKLIKQENFEVVESFRPGRGIAASLYLIQVWWVDSL